MESVATNKKFREFKQINPASVEQEIQVFWESQNIFQKSISTREGKPDYVFYEGPPSANGIPGIHHVLARSIKDIFCRYKTLKGFQVRRKGGWDTHGLPIELSVEKMLGITKKDIGSTISVAEYNKRCREEVMKYKHLWDDITRKMGYWLDLDDPYVTYKNDYIESLWWALKELYNKGYLYKGLKIQPYSPAAGTGLSTHELNQPGCYKDVKDTSCTAMFRVSSKSKVQSPPLEAAIDNLFFLAWTTTPWTLPSNTALAVGAKIDYVLVKTFNPYTFLPINVILAKDLVGKYFKSENENGDFDNFKDGEKEIPWQIVAKFKGKEFEGIRYEQLLPYVQPDNGDAFRVIIGDFVTTEDGTGIVHIAPSFGADDMRVAGENGIGSLTLVDKQGKFVDEVTDFAGRYVKDYKDEPDYVSVDIDICVKLKKENRAFRVEKYEHNYPHCWRTDKPIIYYPLDSWFIKVTAVKDRMVELNKTINWKPANTGTGRFGQWLENIQDWNLSRSRYWGTPLPIWRTEDGSEEICIGSVEELTTEYQKARAAGFDKTLPFEVIDGKLNIDLHKPFVDEVILLSPSGKPMYRELDLIDVWFDSGAMPFAQWHYPFEQKDIFNRNFPADFIAEGVDQTRGWFYTLHALGVMLFDSVAYKNVVSNGLVLDKKGNKMSKRLGNAVDPFTTIAKYGADATRWYMISNCQPWDNLKFDIEGIEEVSRKLYGTLYNTYSFFVLYANIDGFINQEIQIPLKQRPEIDRWIISLLNTLVKNVDEAYADYEPTKAARDIQSFVTDHLSNWYVRLCRRRFWKGEYTEDKIAAYQTLYQCLETLTVLMSPIAPFYTDFLYKNLHLDEENKVSVHLTDFPVVNKNAIDMLLEERMDLAQEIASMVLSLRKKENIKVRQPLQKIMLPVLNDNFVSQIEKIKNLVLSEVNVKELEFVADTSGIVSKKIKPNFKVLGKKLGQKMKMAADAIQVLGQEDISALERDGSLELNVGGESYMLQLDEVEILSDDIKGWLVATSKGITVALDITISDSLRNEGYARELVNRIQNERKDQDFFVTDKIKITIKSNPALDNAWKDFKEYICGETLAEKLTISDVLSEAKEMDINDNIVKIQIEKM